ncbi:hypothetical protein K8R61_03220 [bacterium]|nr:hypothetical protein [bacterium]
MQLKKLINQLQNISQKHGEETEVIMSDNEPVIKAVFCGKYNQSSVVITDRN